MQTEDGQVIEPYSISAGLDYPVLVHFMRIYSRKKSRVFSINDDEALKSAFELTSDLKELFLHWNLHMLLAVLDQKNLIKRMLL